MAIVINGNGIDMGGNPVSNASQIDGAIISENGSNVAVSVGTIIAFSKNSAPVGYIECNGALLSRTIYASLFAVIGTTYGVGDGATTFAIPDLRGEFIRGWDNGRGVDSARILGSYQADDFKSHTHLTNANSTSGDAQGNLALMRSTNAKTNATTATGGNETRPRNIAMMYCIKY